MRNRYMANRQHNLGQRQGTYHFSRWGKCRLFYKNCMGPYTLAQVLQAAGWA